MFFIFTRDKPFLHHSAIESVLTEHRIVTWFNCGFLLGWHRQCSIIPGDGDIDLNQWSSFENYPAIVKAFNTDKRYIHFPINGQLMETLTSTSGAHSRITQPLLKRSIWIKYG